MAAEFSPRRQTIDSDILIRTQSLNELQKRFLCGGVVDSDFPYAQRVHEPMMALSEVLPYLQRRPHIPLYLDLKIQPPLTLNATDYATSIMTLWKSAKLENPLVIEVPDPQSVAAFLPYKNDAITLLIAYPAFYAKQNWTWTGIKAIAKNWLYPAGITRYVRDAKADGASLPLVSMNQRVQKTLKDHQLGLAVFSANTEKQANKAMGMQADFIITDYPDRFR